MNWYIEVLKKYAVFTGRARRKEYWMFVLFNVIISFALGFMESLAGGPGIIANIYALAVFLPGLAVSVRRLHDVGKSGWFMFIALIPLVGAIWLLVLYCTDSQPGENQYGVNPKGL
jgi:uncharacterized membrane protein YhaH (DUF805 family)